MSSQYLTSLQTLSSTNAGITDIASSISPVNIFSTLPKIINELKNNVNTLTSAVAQVAPEGQNKLEDTEAQKLVDAVRQFVSTTRKRNDALLAKAGIIGATPFSAPVAAALRMEERGADSLLFLIASIAPSQADAVKELQGDLVKSEEAVLSKYSPSVGF